MAICAAMLSMAVAGCGDSNENPATDGGAGADGSAGAYDGHADGAAGADAAPIDAGPGAVQTGDGLRIALSPEGAVTGLSIGSTPLPLVDSTGGFALADFKKPTTSVNLLTNPGFESGTDGWKADPGQTIDTTIFHSGSASIRIDVPGPTPASSNVGQLIKVKPNTRYHVGLWARRHGVGVCGAYSSETDDQGKLTGAVTQIANSIPGPDDEWHRVVWDVRTEAATTHLTIRANIYQSTGTLWVDDFFVSESNEGVYEPVRGQLTNDSGGLSFHGALADLSLSLDATFTTAGDSVRVDGTVNDTTGKDRAIGVQFALPLDLTGWTWYDDAEDKKAITAGALNRRTYKSVSGIGETSIYPWSALSGPDVGLSLGLPLDQGSRVFILQHDQNLPATSVTYYFGLTPDAGVHPSSATFSFVLYQHDPAWGMRSALSRYYQLFPDSFTKRPVYEGYLNYANLERFDRDTHQLVIESSQFDDASDFGEGYAFLDHAHGCYDYRQMPTTDTSMPSDQSVVAWLQGQEASVPKNVELIKRLVYDDKGAIAYIADTQYWQAHQGYNNTDQPGWGLNFRVDDDPGVSSARSDEFRTLAEKYGADPNKRDWDSMFTADAIEGYMANSTQLDFRREHFKTTVLPLTFDRDSLDPAMPNGIWDFHKQTTKPLTDQYHIVVYGNSNDYEQVFTVPFVDVPMTEGEWDVANPGRLDRFLRAVAFRKIWRYWHAWGTDGGYADSDPVRVQHQLRRGLGNAVFPPIYSLGAALEAHRGLMRQYVTAIEELSSAGWDPLTYAHSDSPGVERFGAYGDGELHFTLRNNSDNAVDTVLAVDRNALGIEDSTELVWIDILPRIAHIEAFPAAGLPVHLDADGTLALWVGTRAQAAQHGMRLAASTLTKLERLFYTQMDSSAEASWKAARDSAKSGDATQAEALQQAATSLSTQIGTTATSVDLAKLLLRLRSDVSLATAASLELSVTATRLIENCPLGTTTAVQLQVQAGSVGMTNLTATVASPWTDASNDSTVTLSAQKLDAGGSLDVQAQLSVPAQAPRSLMPYLVILTGQTSTSQPFTIAIPIDLHTAAQ